MQDKCTSLIPLLKAFCKIWLSHYSIRFVPRRLILLHELHFCFVFIVNSSAQPIDVSPNNIYALRIGYDKIRERFEPMSQVIKLYRVWKLCIRVVLDGTATIKTNTSESKWVAYRQRMRLNSRHFGIFRTKCRRLMIRSSHATKLCHVNRPCGLLHCKLHVVPLTSLLRNSWKSIVPSAFSSQRLHILAKINYDT